VLAQLVNIETVSVDERSEEGGDRRMRIVRIEGDCGDGQEADCCTSVHGGAGECCGMARQFVTKEERRESLEAYREELKKELTGVEEHLKDMGK